MAVDVEVFMLPHSVDACVRLHSQVIKRLVDSGCSVYAMDHRGQGLSGRETDDQQVTLSTKQQSLEWV
jgi:alpha-beta hydrolase superfamily lysophospholipase